MITPNQPVLLSGLRFDGQELSFRADANAAERRELQLQIGERSAADAAYTIASRELALADFNPEGSFVLPAAGALPLDHDGVRNQQVSARLQLQAGDAAGAARLSLLGPELRWQASVQLLEGNQVRFGQASPRTCWRADSGAGAVSFGLRGASGSAMLLREARGGVAGSLNAANALSSDAQGGWRSSEGLAIGSRAVVDRADLSGQARTPTASINGRDLARRDLRQYGNQLTAGFEEGVTLMLWQAGGTPPANVRRRRRWRCSGSGPMRTAWASIPLTRSPARSTF